MKILLTVFGLMFGMAITMVNAAPEAMPASAASSKVALLISSYGNNGDPTLSYDLEELAQAYLVLQQNGLDPDILSPKGGAVPVQDRKDDLPYIPKQPEDTRSELLWGNQYSTVQQLPTDGAKSA